MAILKLAQYRSLRFSITRTRSILEILLLDPALSNTLQNLGMPQEQDGDRLTPLSAIFEAQSNSSSFDGETLMPNDHYRKNVFIHLWLSEQY